MSIQLIQKYYKEVEDLIQYGGSNIEAVISHKFGDLINGYCDKRQLKLIPQLDYKTKLGKLIRPDGTIKSALRIDYGYWESKANVNIEEEIRKKFNTGYPKTNILFEDGKMAILYQDGQEVKRAKIEDIKELDKILSLFISFEHPGVKNFNLAVAQFKIDIPNVLIALIEMINIQQIENQPFLQKRSGFHEMCKTSINPNISIGDINEMLIQHILTEEIFNAVFSDTQFIRENNIARELYAVEETFFTGTTKRQTLASIKNYYEMIKHAASGIVNHHEKQTFLKSIYENFYKSYNPNAADRLGVVYTPNEIVKFQIESVDYLLHKHFGKTLADKNVEIFDPATGTGTYICGIIEHLSKQNLEYKYKNEIHANEVAILPYYIANLNIEYTFQQKMGYYADFKNICFVDTLDNVAALGYEGKMGNIYGFSTENSERIKHQNERKISVIIGNPPYNARQDNFNKNNANRVYAEVDKRIKDTYIKNGTAQNQIVVYDMYCRFFRWACDRLKDDGIVCFVTNNSLINGRSFDGFRKSIKEEFDYAYIIDLGGNIRKLSGKDGIWMNEQHTIFGLSAAVGICITYLVKIKGNERRDCKINYLHPCDIRATRKEKFDFLQANNFKDIAFEQITPDKNNNWINLTDNDFETLLPLIDKEVKNNNSTNAIFKLFSLGVASHRDEWVYDFSKENLTPKMSYFVDIYQKSTIDENYQFKNNIAWDADLLKYSERKIVKKFESIKLIVGSYRPFVKKNYYFDKHFNGRLYQFENIFKFEKKNLIISVNREGTAKPLYCLMSDTTVDLHFTGDSQCLPFYRYDKSGSKIENITDWGLDQFRNRYKAEKVKKKIETKTIYKEDIFHYIYGVLHNPAYRKKYELNFKREFPRIPMYNDFWMWADWGKELMSLHIDYETVEPFALKTVEVLKSTKISVDDFEPKAKLKADKENGEIFIDELTSLRGIPKEAWEYKLGTRCALEWILDQYKERTPSDPTIREKFNSYKFADYKDYVIDLLKRVCTVSVRTIEIGREMEKIEG